MGVDAAPVRIAILYATQRGHRVVQRLHERVPEAELLVVSFSEDPWEPPYLDDIRRTARASGGQFIRSRSPATGTAHAALYTNPPDLMLAVNWRYILPPEIYRRPRLGAFVFHDALLPEYRGFSPTVWAIMNGEDHTSVTLFEIANDVDAGDIVDQQRIAIGPSDTIASVTERMTVAYLELLDRNIAPLLTGTAPRQPQDHRLATYTCKLVPDDFRIDWSQGTRRILDLVRAVTAPYPGAFTTLDGRQLRIWVAVPVTAALVYRGRIPGHVVVVRPGRGVEVLTADGSLLVTEVRLDDGARVDAAEILTRVTQTLGR